MYNCKKLTAAILTLLMLIVLVPAFTMYASAATTIYVNSVSGSDLSGDGSSSKPYLTFTKGYTMAVSGDTLDLTGTFTWTDAAETGDVINEGYNITKNITLQGHGVGNTIIQSASSYNAADRRIFTRQEGYSLTINDMELRYGVAPSAFDGGAVLSYTTGNLTISNCYIHHNVARQQSAIFSINATSLTIRNTTISENEGNTDDVGQATFAGAICVTDNRTDVGTVFEMTNCTISNNNSVHPPAYAGGIYLNNRVGTNTLTNCTIAYNTAKTFGGGISMERGILNLKNTIIANNICVDDDASSDFDFYGGTVNDNGYNLVEKTNYASFGGSTITGNQVNLNLSATVANNGASATNNVPTLALSAGSVAINAGGTGTNGSVTVPSTDERGFTRDAQYDIGAYEYGAAAPNVAPTVASINRYDPSTETTNAASVVYRVTFSEDVTGVDTTDFALTKTGSTNGAIASLSAVSGSVYDVTVNTITGTGMLRLDLNSSGTGIVDTQSAPIGTGYTSGQTYTVDRVSPTLLSAVRNSDTQITVTLSEACQNLAKSNNGGFTVTRTGGSTTYAVSATAQGADTSHVVLTVADMATAAGAGVTVTYTAGGNGTVADTAGNAMATDGTGIAVSAWDTTAPTVVSINRYNPSSETTNAASVIYRVTFSEAVTGVDTSDFALTATGTASGTVASVSASSGTAIDVTVNGITGNGTLRLDLNSSGTGIADVGGTAIATGYSSGQIYTFDHSAPTLLSAARNSDTQITITLSEACQNLAKANNGGFTVTKTGAGTTYAVSATAQGADTSHAVLTVADMGTAAGAGVTVTYTAGGNGTIADTIGNAMATNSTGVTVAAWDTTAPAVSSINRQTPSAATTNATIVTYRVTFSEAVTGVDSSDFALTATGTASGTIASVSASSGTVIDVTVNNISGDGTQRLDLNGSGTGIADTGGTAIATGYTSGQTYTFDHSAPMLLSAARGSDTQITVTLSEECQNLTNSNNGGFTVTKTGAGTTYAVSATAQGIDASHVVLTVADMSTAAGAGVTVTYTAGGNGTVADTAGNALATDGTGVAVSAWDMTAPTVLSINRQTPASETTNAASVVYRVTFSESVTGVSASDFTLTATGTASGTVASVSAPSGTAIDVTVNGITGNGTLRLDVNSSGTGITDTGGTPIASGYTGGQTYTIDQSTPTLFSAARGSDTQITVTLSEACQNLTKANNGGFTVTKTGVGTTYAVSATAQGADTSHMVLTVADMSAAAGAGVTVTYTAGGNGTVADTAGNALATDGTGVTVSAWDTDAPTVSSINRQTPASETTSAASVVYRVTFSEAVTGVNTADFSLTATGTAAGTIASVSASSGTAIDVTVNSISGSGTLRLDLNGSGTGITDTGGTPIASSYTGGQTYTIDRVAPTLFSAVRNSDTQLTVTLSEACQNLTKANNGGFTVTKTGAGTTYAVSATAQGVDTSHAVLTVADIGTAAGTGITVTYIAGGNGTVADTAGNALATDGTGVTVSAWDTAAPTVLSINRYNPAAESTIASTLIYRVTFSEAVTGVDTSDFALTATDTASGTIASVSASSGTAIDVTVNSVAGVGTLRLDLNGSGTGISDTGGTPIASGYTGGQTYTIDKAAPSLSGAVRGSDTQITVTLSEACQNLAKANDGGFTVTKTGNGATYAVSATAQGTDTSHMVLTVADISSAGAAGVTITYTAGVNGTVADTAGNAMATDGTGVTVAAWDTVAPTIVSAVRDSNTQITVTMSEACLNTTKPNDGGFTVLQTGTATTYAVSATAEGSVILTVANMASASTAGVTVTYTAGGNGTITDLAGNPLATNARGITITAWEMQNPRTGDNAHPQLWLWLALGSGLLAGSCTLSYIRKRRRV